MFNLFYNNNTIRYSSYINVRWKTIKDSYRHTYDIYLNKSNTHTFMVDNRHILNRILKHLIHIIPPENIDEMTAMSYIDMYTNSISRTYDIVNISSKGKIHNGGIFNNSQEVFISTNMDIPIDIDTTWNRIPSVECVYHTSTELTIVTPNNLNSDNLYLFYIDYKLLYLQYKLWVTNSGNTDTTLFIHQIVLPLIVPSLIDISLINRYMYTYNTTPIDGDMYNSLIHVNKYEKLIDKLIKEDLNKLKNRSINYIELLSNIPVLFKDNAYDRLKLIDYLYSNNNRYILWLSRIGIIEFIFNMLGNNGIKSNRLYITMLQGEIYRLSNSKDITHIPSDLQVYIYDKLDNIEFM